MNRSVDKLCGAVLGLIFTHSVLLARHFPLRAKTDESQVVIDTIHILETGYLPAKATYPNGVGYQIFLAQTLKLLGLDYISTDLLSPIIGSLLLSIFILILSRLVQKKSVNFLLLSVAVYSFPGFVNRFRETSHKALTFLLFALMLYYLCTRLSLKWRGLSIITLLLVAVTSFNYSWGAIYGFAALLPLAIYRSRRIVFALPIALSFVFSNYFPLTSVHDQYFYRRFLLPILVRFVQRDFGSRPGQSAVRLIQQWPTTSILGYSFSVWYLTVVGIVIIGVISIISFGIIIYRIWMGKQEDIDLIIGSEQVYFGMLSLSLFSVGDIATFKRLIVVPGLASLSYFISVNEIKRNQKALLMCILIVSSGLAVPRATLDGNINPNNFYSDASQTASVSWAQNQPKGCIYTFERVQKLASYKFGSPLPKESHALIENIIYNSGEDSRLGYRSC